MAQGPTQGELAVKAFALTNQNHQDSLSVIILDDDSTIHSKDPLSRTEEQLLEHCEDIIKQNLNGFFQLGEALAVIRKGRLYRATHSSFETYCREKWKFGRHRALQYIEAHEVAADLLTKNQQISDLNVSQFRALKPLDANQKAEALDRARELAGPKKLTGKHVEQAVKELLSPATDEEDDSAGEPGSFRAKPTITPAVEMPIVTIDMLTGCFDEINELLERVDFPDSL